MDQDYFDGSPIGGAMCTTADSKVEVVEITIAEAKTNETKQVKSKDKSPKSIMS